MNTYIYIYIYVGRSILLDKLERLDNDNFIQLHNKTGGVVSHTHIKKVWGHGSRPFSEVNFNGFIGRCPSFCLLFGGSNFRGTDLLAPVGNQLVPYCLSVVERFSLFQRVCLGRFHCIHKKLNIIS